MKKIKIQEDGSKIILCFSLNPDVKSSKDRDNTDIFSRVKLFAYCVFKLRIDLASVKEKTSQEQEIKSLIFPSS